MLQFCLLGNQQRIVSESGRRLFGARLLISVLSIVPQAVSEMACDELRAVRLGWAMWSEGMMDKAMKSSAASRTRSVNEVYGFCRAGFGCLKVRCWPLEYCFESRFGKRLSG